ncbi:MADS-box transcription factor [Trema orientale]|uniref:MADS-box transcription factor n=1 Tax=Trema orientale TaxID=63057 RepID=A0A2P5FUG6_TREOI|nr:MADS-box transcription factor [Trema orientale]
MDKIFERRKATLKKKAGELGRLCNSEVCIVCYDPNGRLDVWPDDSARAQSIISKYYYSRSETSSNHHNSNTTSNKRKREKLINLSDMLEKKMRKLEDDLDHQVISRNLEGQNHHEIKNRYPLPLGTSLWDEELDALSQDSLRGFSDYLESKIQGLNDKIAPFPNVLKNIRLRD